MSGLSTGKISNYLGLFLTVLIYFALNSARLNYVVPSIAAGLLFIVSVFFQHRLKTFPPLNFLTGAGVLFLLFETVKIALAGLDFVAKGNLTALSQGYLLGAGFYVFAALLITAFYKSVYSKTSLLLFLKIFVFCSFFLSLNAVVPLVQNKYGYNGPEELFFYPALYQIPLSEYVFGRWCSMNWAGDFIAFGIFSGMGMIFYDLYRGPEKKEDVNWAMTLALFFITVINTSVLVLLKSRGSLVFFGLVLVFFLALLAWKWASRYKGIMLTAFITVFFAAAMWMGNIKGAVQELQTLSKETKTETQRSWATNLEGQKRALAMFQERPVFGFGKRNYAKVSSQYADYGMDNDRKSTADFSCMSHYFLLLAEEGAGSFIYFTFLLFFIFYILFKIIQTPSQFKFLAGLSLLSAVLMVLGHAMINDLMDRPGMASLVYLTMGMLAGLFRKDFEHN